jgi:DNA repair protein RadC
VQVGARLLDDFGGLAGLRRVTYQEICEEKGVGPAKAAQIMAAIELGNRIANLPFDDRKGIHSPAEAAEIIMYEMGALEQEEMRVLCLDTRNRLIKNEPVYKGSVNSSQIRVGELFKFAIRNNATSIIVAHNHPSGDPTPSPDDVAVTRAIVQAGKLLDIEVLDHLVIGLGRFVSLKDRGLGF